MDEFFTIVGEEVAECPGVWTCDSARTCRIEELIDYTDGTYGTNRSCVRCGKRFATKEGKVFKVYGEINNG